VRRDERLIGRAFTSAPANPSKSPHLRASRPHQPALPPTCAILPSSRRKGGLARPAIRSGGGSGENGGLVGSPALPRRRRSREHPAASGEGSGRRFSTRRLTTARDVVSSSANAR